MISDIDARRHALDPQRSFIVQAPAGSGKTGLLVYRLLTLLATVEAPQQVLAITFTRKATAEMRERLLELLVYAEQGKRSTDSFEQQGIDLAQAVLEQDRRHQWRLLDAPHQLQILTIDSFCAKLTGSMPWLSRLGDRPQTTDQAAAHYAAAIEQLLSELLESNSAIVPALQTVLLELDFNYNKARGLFSSMLAKRDQWLRHLLQNDLSSMRASLEQAWQSVVAEQLNQIQELLPSATIAELVGLAAYAAQNLLAEKGQAAHLEPFVTPVDAQNLTVVHWQALSKMLLTGDNLRKSVDKRVGFLAKMPETIRIKELLAEFADDSALLNALNEIKVLPETNFNDADWQQLLALEIVLKSLAAFLQLRFRATGECDHSEVTQRANLALQEMDTPTDLGLRMDFSLQHILVDEFQDTSHGQIELLKKLTTGWGASDERKTLFLVGDPMQSIYRFREADVSLFIQVTDNANTQIFPNVAIESLNLSENFRSSKQLVNWFNDTFSDSFPKHDDVLSGAISYAPAVSQKPSAADQSECVYLLAHDREQEAALLLEEVCKALETMPHADDQVAILVRARSQLDRVLPALSAAGINYTGLDIQPLAELQAVIDVLALCKAICRQDDRVAWLSLLRGPWCGLSLAEIKQVAARQDQTIWSQLVAFQSKPDDGAPEKVFTADSSARLNRFIHVMQQTMKQGQQVALASLTRWCWIELGGPATLYNASRDDIETVFELIQSLDRGGDLASMRELDKALKGLYAQAGSEASGPVPKVVVSTMHKAKGLQYHTVILPGLASPSPNSDKEVLMWAEVQNEVGQSNLLLAPFTDQTEASSHYQYLRHLEARRSANESIRLMYVAATRAEQKLILLGCARLDDKTSQPRAPVKGSLLATVWPVLQDRFNFALDVTEQQNTDQTLAQTLSRLALDYAPQHDAAIDWQVSQQLNAGPQVPDDEQATEYEWATSVAAGVGVILHDWLQHNGAKVLAQTLTPELQQRWRAELLNLRVEQNQIDYALRRLREAVSNIHADTQAHFLFQDYAIQSNEFAISTLENNAVKTYRIDRTFVDQDGTRWIVDYKSTPHDRGDVAEFAKQQVAMRHKAQLEKYGELMGQLDTRPIKLAVYFPLLKQLVSWPYQRTH